LLCLIKELRDRQRKKQNFFPFFFFKGNPFRKSVYGKMRNKKDGKTKVEVCGIERKVLVNLPHVKKLLGGEKGKK